MESVGVCDVARERSVFFRHLDDAFCGGFPEFPAVMAGGDDGAVAGQGEPERFTEAVHGVRREHAGTGTAGRAGFLFEFVESLLVELPRLSFCRFLRRLR